MQKTLQLFAQPRSSSPVAPIQSLWRFNDVNTRRLILGAIAAAMFIGETRRCRFLCFSFYPAAVYISYENNKKRTIFVIICIANEIVFKWSWPQTVCQKQWTPLEVNLFVIDSITHSHRHPFLAYAPELSQALIFERYIAGIWCVSYVFALLAIASKEFLWHYRRNCRYNADTGQQVRHNADAIGVHLAG